MNLLRRRLPCARAARRVQDLRRTAVYRDHEAFAAVCNMTVPDDVGLTQCGARLGYDSVQFTHRNEWVLKYEILDTRITRAQTNGCPGRVAADAALFTQGWGGSKRCDCDSNKAMLNCDGA